MYNSIHIIREKYFKKISSTIFLKEYLKIGGCIKGLSYLYFMVVRRLKPSVPIL